MLSVGSTQQVMLEVRFSEVRRAAARQLGINTSFLSDSGTVFGGTGERASSTTLLTNQNGKPTIDIGGILDTFGIVAAGTSLGGLDLFGALDALERRGIVTTLAEPTLIALSGETASFLAGGEFPIPVLQGSGGGDGSSGGRGITVEFKPFGVSLAFTPTVLEDGIISLEVSPEVSSIDTASSISVNGLSIPGLQVRRARTTLELRDGQSFAMAGLLRRDFRDTVRQFPILGSIPIIGALFRSTGFQKEETELVIIVTPRLVRPMRAGTERLPTDTVEQPNDLELFLLGKSEKRGSSSGRQPTPTAPVGATGIEGPSGHILEDGK
jgi:pilus assembly protein CpaC